MIKPKEKELKGPKTKKRAFKFDIVVVSGRKEILTLHYKPSRGYMQFVHRKCKI